MRQDVGADGVASFAYAKAWLQSRSVLVDFLEKKTKGLPLRARTRQPTLQDDPVSDGELAAYEKEMRSLASSIGDLPKMFVVWPEQNLRLKTRERLKPLAASLGFLVVDLYDTFGNSYTSLGWDGHPNADTLKKTADVLLEAMQDDARFSSLLAE